MSDYLTFAGVRSDTLDIIITAAPEIVVPRRKYDAYNVPGRNGDIIRQQNAWENVEQIYEIAYGMLGDNYRSHTAAIAAWLNAGRGYQRLTDTFDPDHFRLAYIVDELETVSMMEKVGTAELKFNCDPRRFLTSGEAPTSFPSAGTLNNPTSFTAKPFVQVYGLTNGAGTISIGGKTMQIDAIIDGMIIDGESQNASSGALNCNYYVSGDWPELAPGSNTISFTGDVTSVVVTPNFWTL